MGTETDPGLEGDKLNVLPEGLFTNRTPSLNRNNTRPDDVVKKGERVAFYKSNTGVDDSIVRPAAKDFTLAQLGESIRAIRKDDELPSWESLLNMLVTENYICPEEIVNSITLYAGSNDLDKITFVETIPETEDENSTFVEINLD